LPDTPYRKTKGWLDSGEFTPTEDELMEAFGIPAKTTA
jgi:hypothetical protein